MTSDKMPRELPAIVPEAGAISRYKCRTACFILEQQRDCDARLGPHFHCLKRGIVWSDWAVAWKEPWSA